MESMIFDYIIQGWSWDERQQCTGDLDPGLTAGCSHCGCQQRCQSNATNSQWGNFTVCSFSWQSWLCNRCRLITVTQCNTSFRTTYFRWPFHFECVCRHSWFHEYILWLESAFILLPEGGLLWIYLLIIRPLLGDINIVNTLYW